MLKLPKAKMHQRAFKAKVLREVMLWTLILPIAFAITWFWMYPSNPAKAVVTNNGVFFYGDTVNAGIMRARTFTSPSTANAEFNGITGGASNILHTQSRWAPTREEMMIGSLRVNGELQIETCTTGCDANGDFTNQWANAGTTITQDCDNTSPAADQCFRAYDLGYESLTGRGMVAYADNVTDKFYYGLWNGSAWSPDASPGSPSVTNEVDFHTGGTGGTPQWIRVIAAGRDLDTDRSNRIMVLLSDTNEDLWGCYWDGSSFSCLSATLEGSLQNCGIGQCFDGAWQDNNTFIAVYYDTAAATLRYQIYTVGTGWGGEQNGNALTTSGEWLEATSSPVSTRILIATTESGNDSRTMVWRGNNATNGWTTCVSTGCPDTAIEVTPGQQATVAFERFSGEGLYTFHDAATPAASDSGSDRVTYTPTATWGNATSVALNSTDDTNTMRSWGSPNSDDVMMITADIDCDTHAKLWTGAAWSTSMGSLEVDNTSYGIACPGAVTDPLGNPAGAALSYSFSWKPYAPWQRNWRFYSGADTASVPTTALAAENTAPTGFSRTTGKFRLRINYAERGTGASVDSRKKLQYTSGCNPNSALEITCTWTDVDDPGGAGIWRYDQDADLTCTATDCDDGVLLTGTVLTGTNGTCTAGNGCGTWVLEKDAAASASMDHNGAIVQESEYVVEANSAASSTTYYFRIYEVEQETSIYREQDTSDCGGGAAQCTYPSLTTDAPAGPAIGDVMRHGNWFSSGAEQSLFWAD